MLRGSALKQKNILLKICNKQQQVLQHALLTADASVNLSKTSYLEKIAEELQTAKRYAQLPGLTLYQLWRGLRKGGEFHNLSLNELMLKCRQKFGDIYMLPGAFGQPPTVALFNVDDFEKVHRTEGSYPIRPGQEVFLHYRKRRRDGFFDTTMGLLGSGEQWGTFRHAVNPVLMQPRNAKLYLEPMQKVNDEFMHRIREIRNPQTKEVPENFVNEISHLALESVATVALDRRLGLIRGNSENVAVSQKLFDNLQIFFTAPYDLGIKPTIYKYIRTPTYRRFEKAMDNIFDITLRYVNEALKEIESKQNNENAEEKSVLQKLVKIDRKVAMIMAMDLLLAGTDTTLAALTGAMLCLAKSPDKQALLRKEILKIVPTNNDKFTIENMKDLPYLRACIKEALRIYPINFGNARETGMDVALSGYRIPKSTRVFINSNLILTEERYYPRPLDFIPERWLRTELPAADAGSEQSADKLVADNLNPFIYLPFGFGPRSCVGKRIVDLEMELTLANLVRNFYIDFKYSTKNAFKNHFINYLAIPLKFTFTDVENGIKTE